MELQSSIESNEYLTTTQAMIQGIEHIIQKWDTVYTDTLLIQSGNGIFLNAILRFIPHVCIIEPSAETFIELQRQYLHLSLFGNSLYYINADAKSFDYTIIVYPALYLSKNDVQEVLREAIRVTTRSILLLFFNIYSLEYYLHTLYNRKEYNRYIWYTPFQLRSLVSSIQNNISISFSSVGLFPLGHTIRTRQRYRIFPYPIGTIGLMSLHIPQSKVMTPILNPLRTQSKGQLHWGGANRSRCKSSHK